MTLQASRWRCLARYFVDYRRLHHRHQWHDIQQGIEWTVPASHQLRWGQLRELGILFVIVTTRLTNFQLHSFCDHEIRRPAVETFRSTGFDCDLWLCFMSWKYFDGNFSTRIIQWIYIICCKFHCGAVLNKKCPSLTFNDDPIPTKCMQTLRICSFQYAFEETSSSAWRRRSS